MSDFLTPEATALIGVAAVLTVITLITVRNANTETNLIRRKLRNQISDLEQEIVVVQSDILKIKKETEKKIDAEYMNRRVEGLINLIKGKH
ncbi:MAG: hypothetical protein ABH803_02910 [Candidatus Micrarchaeota archaeon]